MQVEPNFLELSGLLRRSLEIVEAQAGGIGAGDHAAAAVDARAPISAADDLAMLHIGRKLGTFSAELARVERIRREAGDVSRRIYADSVIENLCDGQHDLRWALASLEASTIPAAAIQCASAVTMLEEIPGRDELHEAEIRRALHRLITSAANVLSRAAETSGGGRREESGLAHLFPLHLDPWATLEDRLQAIEGEG